MLKLTCISTSVTNCCAAFTAAALTAAPAGTPLSRRRHLRRPLPARRQKLCPADCQGLLVRLSGVQ